MTEHPAHILRECGRLLGVAPDTVPAEIRRLEAEIATKKQMLEAMRAGHARLAGDIRRRNIGSLTFAAGVIHGIEIGIARDGSR